jgi:hypothetical protein
MTGQGQLITGVVVGAGAMYLLDPDCGARRRALLQERTTGMGHQLSDRLSAVGPPAPRRSTGAEPEQWSPTIRLILGAAGGLMAVKGLRTRGVGGEVLTALGTGLLARAVSNTPPQKLVDLVTDGSSAIPSAGPTERKAPVPVAAAPEEKVPAHGSQARRATKSTKRRRSGQ